MAAPLDKVPSNILATENPHPSPNPNSKDNSEINGSDDENPITYPEGGFEAWKVVFGCFTTMMASFGYMNTIGALQTMLRTEKLSGYSDGAIGWIFGVYVFLVFACGLIVGPFFDLYGPRLLMIIGCLGMTAGFILGSFCADGAYWQFLLVFGFLMGISHSLLFTPSITTIGHYFLKRRGYATGLAVTGGSMGGIVFTLLIRKFDELLGFAWSVRIIGAMSIALIISGVVLIKGRNFHGIDPATGRESKERPKFSLGLVARNIDIRAFLDVRFTLTTIGIFCIEWALFTPITYLATYALALDGFPTDLAYQLLAIMNAGSVFGRWLPGIIADKIGRFNTMIFTVGICIISVFGLWLPSWYARDQGPAVQQGTLITFALLYGFGSGSGISLTPVCVGQISKTEDYGKRYGTCYFVVSFGVLTGIPIAGELITKGNGDFMGLIVFSGASYIGALAFFTAARLIGGGCKWTKY